MNLAADPMISRRALLQVAGVSAVAWGSPPWRTPGTIMPAAADDPGGEVPFAAIQAAAHRIAGGVARTPCVLNRRLSKMTGTELYVKFENQQYTGAFKERGALNKLLTLTGAERARGVIAASAGNHAQGLAYHAGREGVHATVVMPTTTPYIKVSRTQALGAEVVLQGDSFDEAAQYARQLSADEGLTFVHPFDDAQIIAGQGTVALEMLTDVPQLDDLIVPIGGGGLIAGCAVAAKALKPGIKVYGVESKRYAAMYQRLNGLPIEVGGETLADGLAVHQVGELPYAVAVQMVDEVLVVSETTIEEAIGVLVEQLKSVTEGAGAAGLAALLEQGDRFAGRRVGIILSGGNIDTRLLSTVLLRHLLRGSRLAEIRVTIPDHAGNLPTVVDLIAREGAAVVDVRYDRLLSQASAKEPRVVLTVETRDQAQIDALLDALKRAGVEAELVVG
jgi:threonine dehydratase